MIVPQARLLLWFALIALPCAVAGVVMENSLLPPLAGIAALTLVATADAAAGYGRLDGLSVSLPEVARFSKDREGVLEVRVRNEAQTSRRLRLGLLLPRQLQPASEEQSLLLPAGQEWSRLEWRLTPRRRGYYQLTGARLEAVSPIGFWAMRAVRPVNAEIRVYPNVFAERQSLAALFLNRGAFGVHTHRQVGKGREFEKLREYVSGDSFEDIHWKATARRGRPITKVFQIERTQEVYVVIDSSRLSAKECASSALAEETSILERYVAAALVLGLAAEQQGDLFGLVTFSDRVERFLRARSGKEHYSACRDAIYALEPRLVAPDFDELASFLRQALRRRALLVFLTALDDPVLAESFVRSADLLCGQHLLLVNMMKPLGAAPLFGRDGIETVDDLYLRLGGHLQWQSLRELEKVLQRRGVRFSLLDHEKLSAQIVTQYLNVKRRQIL